MERSDTPTDRHNVRGIVADRAADEMIIELLLGLVGLFVDLLTFVLPDVDLPFWDDVMDFAPSMAQWLFSMDGVLPMADYVQTVRWIFVVWMPGWIAYRITKFVWGHVPVLGGGT